MRITRIEQETTILLQLVLWDMAYKTSITLVAIIWSSKCARNVLTQSELQQDTPSSPDTRVGQKRIKQTVDLYPFSVHSIIGHTSALHLQKVGHMLVEKLSEPTTTSKQ